jgi:predicted small secreted protein
MLGESHSRRVILGVPLLLAATAAGCGKSVSDLASSVKDAASQGVQSVQDTAQQVGKDVVTKAQGMTDKASQTLELAGSIQLTIDKPLQISACYANFSHLETAAAGVLQLQSYRHAQQESFPSVFVRAPCSSAKLSELSGQTLAAQMFVQPEQNGPVWSATAQPVQLKITAVEDKQLKAEIVGGSLANSSTGTTQAVTGTFQGVLP